jgi:hypothetical protein
MALGLVLLGIATGLLVSGCVLVLGGGIWLAALAYMAGGIVGVLGGLAGAYLPAFPGRDLAPQDRH